MLRRLKCWLLGHEMYVVATSPARMSQRVACNRCGRHYGMHHGSRVVIPWDEEIQEMWDRFRQ